MLHEPSASVKFWPKSFHKNSVLFGIFCITNYAWFWTVLATQTVWFLSSLGILDQLNTRFSCSPFQSSYSFIFTSFLRMYCKLFILYIVTWYNTIGFQSIASPWNFKLSLGLQKRQIIQRVDNLTLLVLDKYFWKSQESSLEYFLDGLAN